MFSSKTRITELSHTGPLTGREIYKYIYIYITIQNMYILKYTVTNIANVRI